MEKGDQSDKDLLADIQNIMDQIDQENQEFEESATIKTPKTECDSASTPTLDRPESPGSTRKKISSKRYKEEEDSYNLRKKIAKERMKTKFSSERTRTSNIKDLPITTNSCKICQTDLFHVPSRKCKCHKESCPRYCCSYNCQPNMLKRKRDQQDDLKQGINNVEALEENFMAKELRAKEQRFKKARQELLEREKRGEVVEPAESKPSPMQLSSMSTEELRGDLHDKPVPLPVDYFVDSMFDDSFTQAPRLFSKSSVKALKVNDEEGGLLEKSETKLLTMDSDSSDGSENGVDDGEKEVTEGRVVKTKRGTMILSPNNILDLTIAKEHNIKAEDLAVTKKNYMEVAKIFSGQNKHGLMMIKPFSIKAGIIGGNEEMLVAVGPPNMYGQPGQLAAIFKKSSNKFGKFPGPEEKMTYTAPYFPVRDEEDMKNKPSPEELLKILGDKQSLEAYQEGKKEEQLTLDREQKEEKLEEINSEKTKLLALEQQEKEKPDISQHKKKMNDVLNELTKLSKSTTEENQQSNPLIQDVHLAAWADSIQSHLDYIEEHGKNVVKTKMKLVHEQLTELANDMTPDTTFPSLNNTSAEMMAERLIDQEVEVNKNLDKTLNKTLEQVIETKLYIEKEHEGRTSEQKVEPTEEDQGWLVWTVSNLVYYGMQAGQYGYQAAHNLISRFW